MSDFLRKWKKHFIFVALVSCFINILQLTFAFYMFAIYQNIISSHHEPSLYTITIIALYALLCLGFFNYLRTRILATAGTDLDQTIGDPVFKYVLRGFSAPGKQGYSQGLNDLGTVRTYFNNPGLHALFDAPWAPLYLLLIYTFNPILGLVATTGAVIIFVLSLLQDYLTRERLGSANAKAGRNQKTVDAALRNAEAINSMGMAGNVCERWRSANTGVITDQTVASRYAGALQSVTRPVQMFTQVLIYGIGAYLAITANFDIGLMIASAIIMGQAVGPVMRVMGAWRFTVQALAAYERLNRFMGFINRQPRKMSLPEPTGRIEARQVFLSIDQNRLLQNVSFSLAPGEILGVVGPSGAGKSTLCKILTGVWPSQGGEVRLDDVSLFYWDQDELGRHIGYLAQEVVLFGASVAKNIARMGTVDQERVEAAAKAVNLHEWIASLPDGYDTPLESPGSISPSGGQRQRIALARAIYGNPRVLVLDEPNSNLDTEGEHALMQFLADAKKNRSATCIMVTHKPAVLNAADKILILENGQVSAFGPKDQVFRHLANTRAAGRQAG